MSVINYLYENDGSNQPKGPLLKATSREIPKKRIEKLTNFDPKVVKRLVEMKVIFKSPGDRSYKLNTLSQVIISLYQQAHATLKR